MSIVKLRGEGSILIEYDGIPKDIVERAKLAEEKYEKVSEDITTLGKSAILKKKQELWKRMLSQYESRRNHIQEKTETDGEYLEKYRCEIIISDASDIIKKLNAGDFDSVKIDYLDGFLPNNMKREIMNLVLLFADNGPKIFKTYYGEETFSSDKQKVEEVEKINRLLKQDKYKTFDEAAREVTTARRITISEDKKTFDGVVILDKEKGTFRGYLVDQRDIRVEGNLLDDNKVLFSTETFNYNSNEKEYDKVITKYIGDLESGNIKREASSKKGTISLTPLLGYDQKIIEKIEKIYKRAIRKPKSKTKK